MAKTPRTIVKRVPNAVLYSDGTIRIEGVRASYPHLFKPYKGDDDDGKPSYSIVGLMPKKTHTAAKDLIKEQIAKVIKEKWQGKVKDLPADRKCLRNGDDAGKDDYAGMFTISAREIKRPSVRNRDKTPVETDDQDKFFGGMWVTILIRPWAMDNKFGKRVNANLIAVQYVKEDTQFGEGRMSEDEIEESFDEYEDDGDDGVGGGFDDDDDMGGL